MAWRLSWEKESWRASSSTVLNLAIASREGAASYRVRGYLAAQVIRGRTHISWVWDVYDDDKLRALRITGEEAGGRPGGDPWSAADEPMLRRIARGGMGVVYRARHRHLNRLVALNCAGFSPTIIDIGCYLGSMGLFFTLFLLFCRFLPVVAMAPVVRSEAMNM